jgi:hypothetical protein
MLLVALKSNGLVGPEEDGGGGMGNVLRSVGVQGEG